MNVDGVRRAHVDMIWSRSRAVSIGDLVLLGSVLNWAAVAAERGAPEPSGGQTSQELVRERHALIAAANPHAANSGATIMQAGGNALDAAIAAQLVLNLVEPQSSGVGGGAFLLYFDHASGELISYDGRETAPSLAESDMFLEADGGSPGYLAALVGGNSVCAPGLLRMLSLAHKSHGRLSWAELFVPAINLAESGFKTVSYTHLTLPTSDLV